MKKLILTLVAFAFLLIVPAMLSAQPSPGGDPTGGTNPPIGAAGAPIDGGLSVLLVAGVAYGARKLYKAKQQNEIE